MTILKIPINDEAQWLDLRRQNVGASTVERPIRDHTCGGVSAGDRFGSLTALRAERRTRCNGQRRWVWLCRCDCGSEVSVPVGNLQTDNTKSCGCQKPARIAKARTTHGQSRRRRTAAPTPTYNSWASMIARCVDPNATKYALYGGRGIKVCDRWRKFENFLADMGPRPPGTSIDRFPNPDGNYEPTNCRWATPREQRLNQRPRSPSNEARP